MDGLKYILNNPHKNWNWYCISKNKKITWDYIKNNLKSKNPHPWNNQGLAENPNITYEIIVENFDLLKDKICLYTINSSKKMNFSNSDVLKYIVSYDYLSSNPYLDFNFVEKQISKDWNWDYLSKNKNINKSFIDKYIDKLNIKKLIKNEAFTYDMLEVLLKNFNFEKTYTLYNIYKNPNFDIKWYYLIKKYNINIDRIITHKNMKLQDIVDSGLYYSTSVVENPNVTLEHIVKYFSHVIKKDSYIWESLSKNKAITWDMINETKDKFPWNARNITYNPNITWDIIKNNSKLNWDWNYISMKLNIPSEDIDKFPINFNYLSMNPNINWTIVDKYSDKPWNWNYLVTNSMII